MPWLPPKVMPPVVHPTRVFNEHIFEPIIVPHVHPTHMQYNHHKIYRHEHYCPHTESTCCDVKEEHIDCCCEPMPDHYPQPTPDID